MLLLAFMLTVCLAALPQTSVPATARQAAASRQFAARLHPQAKDPLHKVHSIVHRTPVPAQGYLYVNGPVNGICDIQNCDVDAWTINFGYAVTNSIGGGGTAAGFEFAVWMAPGDTLTSVQWSLGSTPFGSDIAQGTASGSNLSSVFLETNSYGYDIYQVAVSGLNASVNIGTWLTLQNASVPSGDPVFWDENNGPSQAQETSIGTIPSESFNVIAGNGVCAADHDALPSSPVAHAVTVTTPAPAQTFTVIHNFTGGADGGDPTAGLTIDRHGNLYGTASTLGSGWGDVYKMSSYHGGWVLTPLYSFQGGNDGYDPGAQVSIGSNGILYSTTVFGGGNGCYDGEGCGTIFALRPAANARGNALSQWTESQLYRFTGSTDGYSPSSDLVQDQAGNLYGVTWNGGAWGKGSIFELQHTASGWQFQTLYSFTGGSDGAQPIGNFLIDSAGNLYGAAFTGGYAGCGTVFELSPSAGSWTEKTIYSFLGAEDAGNPEGLTIDQAGNLYGVTAPVGCLHGVCDDRNANVIFMLSPAQGSWNFTAIGNYSGLYQASISMGADGNLYGSTAYPGLIFKMSQSGGIWTYTDMYDFEGGPGFWPQGNIVEDASGNLYGVTNQGGSYSDGTVWQIAP
jgi:uncharacterized repeat protein (TIGR03803 family)